MWEKFRIALETQNLLLSVKPSGFKNLIMLI